MIVSLDTMLVVEPSRPAAPGPLLCGFDISADRLRNSRGCKRTGRWVPPEEGKISCGLAARRPECR